MYKVCLIYPPPDLYSKLSGDKCCRINQSPLYNCMVYMCVCVCVCVCVYVCACTNLITDKLCVHMQAFQHELKMEVTSTFIPLTKTILLVHKELMHLFVQIANSPMSGGHVSFSLLLKLATTVTILCKNNVYVVNYHANGDYVYIPHAGIWHKRSFLVVTSSCI